MPGSWAYMKLGSSLLREDHMINMTEHSRKYYNHRVIIDRMLFEINGHKMYACTLVGLHETREILKESQWVQEDEK